MIYPWYTGAYVGASCVILVGTFLLGRGAMLRTSLTILINWIVCSLIVFWLNNPTPWFWWALIDAAACTIVTIRPAARMQAAIGGIYLAEIICHFVYGISANPDLDYYLTVLDKLSFVQLGLLGCWLAGGTIVRLAHLGNFRRVRGGHHFAAEPPASRLG